MIAHAAGTDESLAIVMLFTAIWVGWIGWTRLHDRGFGRIPRPAAFGLLGVAGILVVTSAFAPRKLLGPKAPPSTAARPASTATLAFTSPTEHLKVTGTELNVVLDLRGGTVVQATSATITPSTGHIHILLDGNLVSMTYGTEQIVDLTAVAPGSHTLTAEFVAADHLPFSPPVTANVDFTKVGS